MSDRRASQRGPRRQLVYQLIETARLLGGFIDSVAVSHGATRAQWGLLARLRRREGVSQAELAAEMQIAPISLCRLVDRTQAQGFIERRSHAEDRRINRLFLTPKGRAIVNGLDMQREEIAKRVLAGISEIDIALTSSLLTEVEGRIQSTEVTDGANPRARLNKRGQRSGRRPSRSHGFAGSATKS